MEREKKEPTTRSHCQNNYCLTIINRERKDKARPQLYCSPLSYSVMLTYRYKDNEKDKCHPHLETIVGRRKECQPKTVFSPQLLNDLYSYFTKLTSYSWQIDACIKKAENCTDWSQKWRFSVENFSLEKPRAISPPDNIKIEVGLPVIITWSKVEGAMSYRYEVRGVDAAKISTPGYIVFDYPQLKLNTVYRWRAKPCWSFKTKPEKCEDNWSEWFSFKTTGRPPKIETMKPTGSNIIIPTIFEWENVPGAKSYIFKIQGENLDKELITEKPNVFLEFPILHQETNYSWQVKTCARTGGEICGEWSSLQTFTTFKLEVPTNLVPENNSALFTGDSHTFSWDLPAKYHQFKLTYQKAEKEEREKCIKLAEQGKTKILTKNSLFLPLECRGNYQWQVRGCLDRECTEGGAGEWSSLQNITLTARIAPKELRAGLIPCGRKFDNPNTLWVETDRCELRHLFIILYSILNFFLWTIIPLILVALVAISGIIFYFALSAGDTDPVSKVKELWKAAGIGFVIIFIAWSIVSFILTLFGYQIGIFGPWWRI